MENNLRSIRRSASIACEASIALAPLDHAGTVSSEPQPPHPAPNETTGEGRSISTASHGLSIRPVVVAIANGDRRDRIALYWRERGHCVTAVATGSEVLDVLADALLGQTYMDATPMLMILEDVMPGVLGRTIVDGIRDLGWTTPVVLLGERKRPADCWTVALPTGASESSVEESSQALAKRHADFATSTAPASECVLPLATAHGIEARWCTHVSCSPLGA